MVGQDFMSCKHRAQLYRKQPSKSRFAKVLFIFNVIFEKKKSFEIWWWFLFSSFFLLIAITVEEVIFNLRLNKIQFLWGFPGITRSPLNEHWFPTFLFWANHLIAPCCIVIAVRNTNSMREWVSSLQDSLLKGKET